jgi:hypothetical protein
MTDQYPQTFWHVAHSCSLDSITQHGLLPRAGHDGVVSWGHAVPVVNECVYLNANALEAVRYVEFLRSHYGEGVEAVILEVSAPALDFRRLTMDHEDMGMLLHSGWGYISRQIQGSAAHAELSAIREACSAEQLSDEDSMIEVMHTRWRTLSQAARDDLRDLAMSGRIYRYSRLMYEGSVPAWALGASQSLQELLPAATARRAA